MNGLRKNLKILYQIFIINFKEFIREPEIIFWGIIFPIGLALILGLAFDTKFEYNYPIGIIKNDSKYNFELNDSKNLKMYYFNNEEEALQFLRKGKIYLFLELKNNNLWIYYDKKNNDAKLAYLEIIKSIQEERNTKIIEKELTIPGTRYIDFLIPGLVSIGIMNSAIWGIGWNFIQMRIKKLLKLFYSSPVDKNVFFIGYIVSRSLLSILETIALLVVINFFFQMEFMGNLLDFIIAYISGYINFSGIAILAGSRTSNTSVGQGIMNAITLPMILLSGVFFSYESYPEWMISIIQYLPLTLLIDTIRSIYLEGLTFWELKTPILLLTFQGIIFYFFGKKIFVWN